MRIIIYTYIEEADDANKDSALIGCELPSGERLIK
jgi:hypothetical protein